MDVTQQSLIPRLGALDLRLTAQDFNSAVNILGGKLAASASIADADLIIQTALRRETEASTALPIGVAIPHARIAGLESIFVAVGISPEGINWAGQNVSAVFLVAVPTSQATAYLGFVQRLAKLLRDPKRLVELKTMRDEKTCRNWLAQHLNLAS